MSNFRAIYDKMKGFEKLVFHACELMESMSASPNGYYTECGRFKPWTRGTVNAAVKRNLVTIVKDVYHLNILYVMPTDAGYELYRELKARK